MQRQVIAFANDLYNLTHVTKIKLRIDTLAKQIHRHDHDIHIAGTLAITKQGALDTICTSKHTKLSRCHRTASVIMRMQANSYMLTLGKITTKILDLISEYIGH